MKKKSILIVLFLCFVLILTVACTESSTWKVQWHTVDFVTNDYGFVAIYATNADKYAKLRVFTDEEWFSFELGWTIPSGQTIKSVKTFADSTETVHSVKEAEDGKSIYVFVYSNEFANWTRFEFEIKLESGVTKTVSYPLTDLKEIFRNYAQNHNFVLFAEES